MRLREFQAKSIFADYGISVPQGHTAQTPEEAAEAAQRLAVPVVLKPQLGVKGRDKVGGIAFADDSKTALIEAKRLFAMKIKGESVRTLLVEEKLAIANELYIAASIDYAARRPVLVASQEGGVEIEEVAKKHPDRIFKIPVNILTGPDTGELERIARRMGEDVARHLEILYRIFRDCDAELVEINPLVRTHEGKLSAADAVLNIDDDSLLRHENLRALKSQIPVEDPIVEEAAEKNWTYIDLQGNIGILSSGAGLTMTILDLVHMAGGEPANFLDTAQIDDAGIYEAFELLSRAKRVRVLLVNMFAGLNRCDQLATGITRYLEDHPTDMPIVVRMVGNAEEEGHRLLRRAGISPFKSLESAVDRAVRLSQERET